VRARFLDRFDEDGVRALAAAKDFGPQPPPCG
jgi:hypothetical protein